MESNSKEWIQYGSAALMIVSGVTLSFISFFVNGDVTDGVLWYTAQGLTFAGAIFGVSVYFHQKIGEGKREIKEYIDNKLNRNSNDTDKEIETQDH